MKNSVKKLIRSKTKFEASPMENIINNPGLRHITENIFLNLDFKDLVACQLINKSCKEILNKPLFWLSKLIRKGRVLESNQRDWKHAIQTVKNSKTEKYI